MGSHVQLCTKYSLGQDDPKPLRSFDVVGHEVLQHFVSSRPAFMFFIADLLNFPCIFARLIFCFTILFNLKFFKKYLCLGF
jgi:hypothetical protein